MKIYKTCRELSMFRFYEILDTKDYKYLIHDYDNAEITKELQGDLNEVWGKLFQEYIKLKDDKEIRLSFKKLMMISKLETKLSICVSLLNGLITQTTKKGQKLYIKELSAWGFPINGRKKLSEEILRITKNFKSLKSSIKIKQVAYEKEFRNELSKEKVNIDEQIVNVEQILGNGAINSHTTTVSKWIFYVKRANRLAKKRTKNRV